MNLGRFFVFGKKATGLCLFSVRRVRFNCDSVCNNLPKSHERVTLGIGCSARKDLLIFPRSARFDQ
jgi:hypothetical protein